MHTTISALLECWKTLRIFFTFLQHTLQAQNTSRRKTERQPASVRVVCREKAPGYASFCATQYELVSKIFELDFTYHLWRV